MQITAAEFKAKCLKIMDEIEKTREPVIITKRGKPIARLMPVEEPPQSMFGYMKGTITIHGDIVSPIEEEWSVITGDEDHLYQSSAPQRESGDNGGENQ